MIFSYIYIAKTQRQTMRIYYINFTRLLIYSLFAIIEGHAQQAGVFAGGGATHATGSFQYSAGEVASDDQSHGSGVSLKLGVQQPSEFFRRQLLLGEMRYANLSQTPFTHAQLQLIRSGSVVRSAATQSGAAWSMNWVDRGPYALGLSTAKPWGGVNATDALLIINHFSNTMLLGGIQRKAADVDANGVVNATDALQTMQRFVGLRNSLAAGDFVMNKDSVRVVEGRGNQNQDVTILAVGDVNSSYVPTIQQREEWNELERIGVLWAEGKRFSVPIHLLFACSPAGVSLEIRLPEGVRVTGVRPNSRIRPGALVHASQGRDVRLAWYDLQAPQHQAGDVLCFLECEAEDTWNSGTTWQWGSASEIADHNGVVYENLRLAMPTLADRSGDFQALIYPNPSSDDQFLKVYLREEVKLNARLMDAFGREVHSYNWQGMSKGWLSFPLELENVEAGHYQLEIKATHADGSFTSQTIKLVRYR